MFLQKKYNFKDYSIIFNIILDLFLTRAIFIAAKCIREFVTAIKSATTRT